MAIVAGIDEAGYGPVLGPLVVSLSAFDVPDKYVNESMWSLLAEALSRKPSKRRAGIAIGDSKKLYNRRKKNALEHLERAVLAMLATADKRCGSLKGLLGVLDPNVIAELGRYPWYSDGDVKLPISLSDTDLDLAANSLSAAMDSASVKLLAIRSVVIPAGQFNDIVQATRNKSTALLDATMRLVAYMMDKFSNQSMRIYVDRQGGRKSYRRAIQRTFDGWGLKILDETDTLSAYRISSGTQMLELKFMIKGEDEHLPIALGSMVSKYLRELMMEMFNRFWIERVDGLESTAGYYTDGRRFFGEISGAIDKLGVDRNLIYRSR